MRIIYSYNVLEAVIIIVSIMITLILPAKLNAEASGPGDPIYTILTVNIDGIETLIDSSITTTPTKYIMPSSSVYVTSSPVDYDYEVDGGSFPVDPSHQSSTWKKDGNYWKTGHGSHQVPVGDYNLGDSITIELTVEDTEAGIYHDENLVMTLTLIILKVDIEINNTSDDNVNDDIICRYSTDPAGRPTLSCRAKVQGLSEGNLSVIITNATGGGDFRFPN